MSLGIQVIIGSISVWLLLLLGIWVYRMIFLHYIHKHRVQQTQKIKFLQVKLPKKERESSGENETIMQSMKQNIEIMNQVYKNFYAIFDDSRKANNLWNNYISMELFIEREVIKFILGVPEDFVENVEKMISSFYTGAVVDLIPMPKLMEAGKFIAGGEFLLKKHSVYPIKTYESLEADPMDSLLWAFSKLNNDEKMSLQILVSPLDESRLKKLRGKAEKVKEGKDYGWFQKIRKDTISWIFQKKDENQDKSQDEHKHDFSQQQLADFDKKLDDELFLVKMRAIVTSPEESRSQKIIDDLSRLFNQYNSSWLNGIKFEKARDVYTFAREFTLRLFFTDRWIRKNIQDFNTKLILNIKELSSIIHFPNFRFNKNIRLARQKYKVVSVPENMPEDGMLLWHNTYGGIKKEVRLQFKDRFRHVYVIGQTGTGKTTLLLSMAMEDMKAGHGFCYLDPHGDVAEQILDHIPRERVDDLIYFDLSNIEYPIGFNPLQAEDPDERDVVVNDMVEMFVNMYGHEIFGPRIQDYFRNACFLLMEQPEGWTLVDIMRLFTDPAFAESKIRNVKDPVISARWNKTYKSMWDREKAEIIPFIQAKFAPFTTGVYVRNIIGQPKSSFNFYEAMQQKKIIICNLSKGLAWEINSQLIGRMVSMQIKLAALKRAKIDENDRVPFFLYVDEFQNYVSKSFESILSEARKYRLWLAVAHQYIDQLKQWWLSGEMDLSKTIFGNVWTIFSLKVGAPDAEFLENEFAPEFSKSDLINMDQFKGIMKMSINSQQSKPFSFTPMNPHAVNPVNTPEKVDIIKQISALKRGIKRELVDKEIYFRIWV